MNNDRVTEFLSTLPHVVTTIQWGDNLLFWAGDKAIGGKMFCLLNLEPGQKCVAAFAAGPEGFAELCEREDISPAPYLARAHWVCVEQWQALSWAEWKHLLTAAHAIVHGRLPARTRAMLALPAKEQARLVHERKAKLTKEGKAKLIKEGKAKLTNERKAKPMKASRAKREASS